MTGLGFEDAETTGASFGVGGVEVQDNVAVGEGKVGKGGFFVHGRTVVGEGNDLAGERRLFDIRWLGSVLVFGAGFFNEIECFGEGLGGLHEVLCFEEGFALAVDFFDAAVDGLIGVYAVVFGAAGAAAAGGGG